MRGDHSRLRLGLFALSLIILSPAVRAESTAAAEPPFRDHAITGSSGAGSADGRQATDGREAEKEEIARVISSVIGWAKDKDLDLFFGSIAQDDDYISVTPGKRVVKRFEDVKQSVPFWMSPDFKYVRHELKDLEITFARCGEVAWFYCVLDDINSYKGAPASWENARWTGVVEKRDGKWVVVQQHFSFQTEDRPVPKLSEKLSVFEPLIGPTWVGSIPDDPRMGEIVLKWEVLLNGLAVRLRRSVTESDHWLETTYYWDESSGKIAFLSLSNNGVSINGFVAAQEGRLTAEGVQRGPGIERISRRTYRLDKDGKLLEDDQFRSADSDEWRRTHVILFVAK